MYAAASTTPPPRPTACAMSSTHPPSPPHRHGRATASPHYQEVAASSACRRRRIRWRRPSAVALSTRRDEEPARVAEAARGRINAAAFDELLVAVSAAVSTRTCTRRSITVRVGGAPTGSWSACTTTALDRPTPSPAWSPLPAVRWPGLGLWLSPAHQHRDRPPIRHRRVHRSAARSVFPHRPAATADQGPEIRRAVSAARHDARSSACGCRERVKVSDRRLHVQPTLRHGPVGFRSRPGV